MAAARCSQCDLLLPSDRKVCPVCGRDTWKVTDAWESDWEHQVEILRSWHYEGQPINNADVSLVEKDGRLYVANDALREYGYHDLKTDDVIRVRNRFYEVVSAVQRGTDVLAWWIELVPTRGVFNDLPTLTKTEYEKLETTRGIR